jgi:hypothetical protein
MDKVFQILARPAGLSAAYALDAYAFSFGSEQVRSYHCAPKIYKILARPAGFEPATTSLEGRCSIQLSYGRVPRFHNVALRFWQSLRKDRMI